MRLPKLKTLENYLKIDKILKDIDAIKDNYYSHKEKVDLLKKEGLNYNDYDEIIEFNRDNMLYICEKKQIDPKTTAEFIEYMIKNYSELSLSLIKYIWLEDVGSFYHIDSGNYHDKNQVAINMRCKAKEVQDLIGDSIPVYKELYYGVSPRPNQYNLLNKNDILPIYKDTFRKEDSNDIKNIQLLIDNVLGGKKDNIEWFEKALLYKYYNLGDPLIPAVVIYGNGGSGKGTLMKLLGTIFGYNNIQDNLGQNALTGGFDVYTGQKLVVEFAEISNFNTNSDKGVLNKLKNLVGAKEITVNRKYAASYTIDNLAWFFISSNSERPIMLDNEQKGNRRFTIIKTGNKLDEVFGYDTIQDIISDIYDKKKVSKYLKYIEEKYGKVDRPISLVNEDMGKLLDDNKSDQEIFFESIWQEFSGQKVDSEEISRRALLYCNKEGLNHNQFMRYVRNDLPFFVERKQFRLEGTKMRTTGYIFNEYDGRFDNLETLDKKIYLENV